MNLRPQNILPAALSTLAVLAVATGPAEAAKMASFTPEGPGAQVKAKARTAGGCDNVNARAGQASESTLASSTVCLLNVERSSRGLRPLRVNRRLSAAAQQHTNDMVRKRYFSHNSRSGSNMSDRIRRNGYLSGARSWMIGENLAWGSGGRSTPRSIVRAWMASPGHRHNILTRRFREIGIGVASSAPVSTGNRGATYTTTFGTRR
ncbi:MAG TPA: CAP domain-containing protein [Thermoleophilaceae bacterium]|nr:CAP domain-containing protein [Thermoleophilaceae bacterium]